jgi:hypothetical protein
MDAVIAALERTLSRTREPGLRQQLVDTIDRLRKEKGEESAQESAKRTS